MWISLYVGRAQRAPQYKASATGPAVSIRRFLLGLERFLDLLPDVRVVLGHQLFFFLREDAKRHAHEGLGELHVQPVLPILDPAGDAEEQPPRARTHVAQLDVVPRHGAVLELAEEADAAGLRGHRRKVVDRVARDLRALLERAQIPAAVVGDRRQRYLRAVG